VLIRLAWGYSNKEIAADLDLSVKTVETYKVRIGEKLASAAGPRWCNTPAAGMVERDVLVPAASQVIAPARPQPPLLPAACPRDGVRK